MTVRRLSHPETQILRSSNERFHARFSFPQPHLQELLDGGEEWIKVSMPGLAEGTGHAGEPAVPVLRRLVAVPQGAEPYIASARPELGQELYANLYPFQPLRDEFSTEIDRYLDNPPPAELFAQQPFAKDQEAYGSRDHFPRSICRVTSLGTARDLQIAVLECACGQYNPSARVLRLFDSMEIEVGFKGGTGNFVSDAALNPFESGPGVYTGAVLNHATLSDYVAHEARSLKCIGEELLILTHPAYRSAADALAQWRRDHGIPTNVFNVNDGDGPGPDTNEEIRAFIHERYDSCAVRPSYVLLFGDVPDIPTWTMQRLIKPKGTMIATDFPYGTLASDPEALVLLPDFAVGRIPLTDTEQAEAVVEKIIKYESEPPPFSTAYHTVTVASYFQCCNSNAALSGVENGRAFILNAEFLRDALISVGYDVERVYDTSTAYAEDPPYMGDTTPQYFADSTPLPPELAPGSGFPWDGGTQDVLDALNAGRSFVFHLDHGYTGGWGDPPFDKSNVASLVNSYPPVVFNMDCSSGNFEATCFAEVALQPAAAGAIGVFGWTRMSNTAYYRSLLEGILSALWPPSFPEFGNSVAKKRLGDVLNHSKIYMAQEKAGADPQTDGYKNAVNHVRLYHLIGDPTLEPWTLHPVKLPHEIEVNPIPEFIEIHYGEEGTTITAQQLTPDGMARPIGRAAVRNGRAQLSYVVSTEPGPLLLAATKVNAIAHALPTIEISAG